MVDNIHNSSQIAILVLVQRMESWKSDPGLVMLVIKKLDFPLPWFVEGFLFLGV